MVLATVAWAAGETLMRRRPPDDRPARACWTVGIALALLHVVLAFHFVYGWSHEAAVDGTTRQTAELTGLTWRGGLFVNYAFLAIWLADTCWWWISRASRATRPWQLEAIRFALFLFMFVSGAIVFASGPARLVGVASVSAVLLTSLARRREATAV